ncbi:unnamed protein product [Polarella glacialis]|uniref:Phospholipid:diacylglycerol acyltransferase n=1 Tax=Polarella glacialis TaxID=89957 RepID=A0A813GD84_POLGL|nr:unnamed protein product [Polarella glacialis]
MSLHQPPERLPVILVPGFCSSGLEVQQSSVCPLWEGRRVWMGLSKLGFQSIHGKGMWDPKSHSLKNKWLQHLMLAGPDLEQPGVRLKVIEGMEGVRSLAPDSLGGLAAEASYIFAPVIDLLESMGYREGVDLVAASYDWRFAPSALEKREGYCEKLVQTVEALDRRSTGVAILAHSMGNKMVQYFLAYVKRSRGQQWLDRHINVWIAAAAPHLGAAQAARATLLGDRFGLGSFISDSEALALARSLSASPWLFPIGAAEKQPMFWLRRGGLLELRNFSASLENCGIESKRNRVMLTVEVCWGEDCNSESLTTKTSTAFDGKLASFDVAKNLIQFGGPAVLPRAATISVIVKEKGVHDDANRNWLKRCGKGVIGCVQLIGEASQGRGCLGVPKASTGCASIASLLEGSSRGSDGFVQVRLPICSTHGLRGLGAGKDKATCDRFVSFDLRWLGFSQVREAWLGSQTLKAFTGHEACQFPASVRHSRRAEQETYDPLGIPQLLKMEACEQLLEVWEEYYEKDQLYDHTGQEDCPPIRRVLAAHGVGLPTEVMYALRIRTARLKPAELQTRFVLDDEAELATPSEALTIEGGIVKALACKSSLSGDGVVPICSLDHCKSWAGSLHLQLLHLEGAEHRDMLADPRFHRAIRDAVILQPLRPCPPLSYSIAGTFSQWMPVLMGWQGTCFTHVIRIGEQGRESFQILPFGSNKHACFLVGRCGGYYVVVVVVPISISCLVLVDASEG